MHPVIRIAAAAICGPLLSLHAQPASADPPDPEWQNLSRLLAPGSVASVPANPSDDRQKSGLQLEIERLQQVAQAAKAYYSAKPDGARAAEARKWEILAELQALQLGAPDPAGRVLGAAQAFRKNRSLAAEDRFDVAFAAECTALRGPLSDAASFAAREKLADALHEEFGGLPQVISQYVSLLRTADPATAARIAGKLNDRQLPDGMRRDVTRALAAVLHIGKPVELTMSTLGGGKIDFAGSSEITVVYFWNAWAGTGDLALPAALKTKVPAAVQWIYVGLGGTAPGLAEAEAKAAFPGRHCHDPSGLAGAAAASLGINYAPGVAVLGPKGRLIGFGALENLPALLQEANR